MKKFKLIGSVTISVYTEIYAESFDETVEMAKERDIEIYNYGDKHQQELVWVSDSFDGAVRNIYEED